MKIEGACHPVIYVCPFEDSVSPESNSPRWLASDAKNKRLFAYMYMFGPIKVL